MEIYQSEKICGNYEVEVLKSQNKKAACLDMYCTVVSIGYKELSAMIKEKLSKEDQERWKNNLFYPIDVRRNYDLSFDVTFGVMAAANDKNIDPDKCTKEAPPA